MAVARIEPARVRRYNPGALRGKPIERRARAPRRTLVVGVIVAGSMLQHVLATTPAEPQPTPLAVAALPAAAAPAVIHAATLAHVHATAHPVAATRIALPSRDARTAHPAAPRAVHAATVAPPTGHSSLLPPIGPAGDAARGALASNPQGLIMHVPSVSVTAIRSALRDAGSPALDAGYADHKDAAEYIWDAGRVLGIDPAVLIAIFHHESVFGTQGMARLTNSVGNIRPLPGQPSLDGYRLYRSWEEGIDDCYRLLREYADNGATTVSQAIPVWAPPADNNDDSAYVASVMDTMGALYDASTKA